VIVAKEPTAKLSSGVKFAGMVIRALFLIVLIAITARAASPQIEKIWFTAHIFIPPRDPGAYQTWLYLGPAILPLSILCALVVW
jgi:hypothetical protein